MILCDDGTDAQVKAFRLLVNRSVTWAQWDEELLSLELADLRDLNFDLGMTGFEDREIDEELALPDDEEVNIAPPLPAIATSRPGDLWLCGPHRVLCGDTTDPDVVARVLNGSKPLLMVTDPP